MSVNPAGLEGVVWMTKFLGYFALFGVGLLAGWISGYSHALNLVSRKLGKVLK